MIVTSILPSVHPGNLVRVVIDTNIVISGIFFGGNPREVLKLWNQKKFELVCSHEILEEYEDVLFRLVKKTKKRDEIFVHSIISLLSKNSDIIIPEQKHQISRDPGDDKFIECAISGKAIFIISGDSDLLDLMNVSGVEIITAREFLERLSN